jgi:hypothetical protein
MNRNHVFDSNGPDMRLRGTAQQLFEKYLQLGRDATGSGDRVTAEGYFQHAEHYFRILNAMSQAQGGGQQQQQRRYQSVPDTGVPGDGGADGMGEQPETVVHSNGGGAGAQANGTQVNGHAPEGDAEGDAPPSTASREPV